MANMDPSALVTGSHNFQEEPSSSTLIRHQEHRSENLLKRKFEEKGDLSGDNEKEDGKNVDDNEGVGADDDDGADENEGTDDEEGQDVDDDEEEDSSDESYPGEDVPLPEFDSSLKVFIDPNFEDAEKHNIWSRRHADIQEAGYNYRSALERLQTILDGSNVK
jgi:hypothetical protein